MDDKELDSMIFAVEEKRDNAEKQINNYNYDNKKQHFHRGQYCAYVEILSMLNNTKSRNNETN